MYITQRRIKKLPRHDHFAPIPELERPLCNNTTLPLCISTTPPSHPATLTKSNSYSPTHAFITPRRLDILATPPETRSSQFLALNPNARIPVLVLDNGTPLAESNAILFYLVEDTPYLPDNKIAKAQVLQWLFFEQYSHEPFIAV